MRRYLSLLVGALSLVAVTVGVAWSATASHGGPGATNTEHRYVHLYRHGPNALVDGDSGGVGTVAPIALHLPSAAQPYSGTVTVSLGYQTYGDGLFRAGAWLETPSAPGREVGTVLPHGDRILGPAKHRTSTTLVFRLLDVPGGRDLELHVKVGLTPREDSKSGISTANVLVEARLSSP